MSSVAIGPFVRFALAGSVIVYQNWDTLRSTFDRVKEDVTGPVMGYSVQHIFQMKDATGAYSDRERGLVGMHWINSTGGDPDATWTTADYVMIEAGFEALWNAWKGAIPAEFRLVEHRWYAFGPGVNAPNPPSRINTLATPIAGTQTTIMPHQVACTVTFRTALRRHWGRIYLPIASPTNYKAGGQLLDATTDGLAAAASTFLKSGTANGLTPCVWDRTRRVALGVTAVEVDSVPDIIRRRRSRTTSYRKILTA